jgi:hypothetical protein
MANRLIVMPCVLTVLSASAPCMAQAPVNVGVEVSNTSPNAVLRVFAKGGGLPKWQSLPEADIAGHSKKLVRVPSETNCYYDLRFEFAGGRTEEHRVDVCKHQVLQVGASR